METHLRSLASILGLVLATASAACVTTNSGNSNGSGAGDTLGGGPGTGTGSGTGNGSGAGGSGTTSGTFYYTFTDQLHALDVASGTETVTKLPSNSRGGLGFGGGFLTDVEETGIATYDYIVHLRTFSNGSFKISEDIGTLSYAAGDEVWGIAQPSPDASLFFIGIHQDNNQSVERLFDRSGRNLGSFDIGSPVWVGPDRIVYASGDSLYTMTVSANGRTSAPTRIGPQGLGAPGEAASPPAVSRDGTMVTWVQSDMVWRMGMDGSALTQVTKQSIEQHNPMFSPDGSTIVVQYGSCRTTWAREVLVPIGGPLIDPLLEGEHVKKINPFDPDKKQRTDISVCGVAYWAP